MNNTGSRIAIVTAIGTGKSDRERQPWRGGASAFRGRSMASSPRRGTLRTAGLIGAAFAALMIAGGSPSTPRSPPGEKFALVGPPMRWTEPQD
jgi:hypothetical protein